MDYQWDDMQGTGHLKAGFLGFSGSGKTYTAVALAIIVREALGLEGPISMFDTEGGSVYLRQMIEEKTGKLFLVKRARSFDDAIAWAKAIQEQGVSIGIMDSISHVWTELMESYLAQKNASLIANNKKPVKRLEFQDWSTIKRTWAAWTDVYLNSPISMIVCGRAGWEWDFEENEETGKKELRKTGIKMRAEGEFTFEPSLLVEMQRVQDLTGDATVIRRQAAVLKDRFGAIDGQVFIFESAGTDEAIASVKRAFGAHVARLVPGQHAPVDTALKTDFNVDESGDAEWTRERRERTILAEEIQGEIVSAYPGQTTVEKKAKADLLLQVFGTRSWTQVENMDSKSLRAGLGKLREILLARLQAKNEPAEPVAAEA